MIICFGAGDYPLTGLEGSTIEEKEALSITKATKSFECDAILDDRFD